MQKMTNKETTEKVKYQKDEKREPKNEGPETKNERIKNNFRNLISQGQGRW